MNISQEEMNDINKIQLDIFKDFVNVCEQLNLKYYAVHGTLLGALRCEGFFPFDDDIDVAMPRKDYDILIKEGQKLLKDNYFIQSNETEKEYPLTFAKIRDNNTAFIQPVLNNFNVNKGIYIDIFPIDNFPTNKLKQKIIVLKEKILSARVVKEMKVKDRSTLKKLISSISTIFYPNINKATTKRSNLYKKEKFNGNCIVYGGKVSEKNIPFSLFGDGTTLKFEDLSISVPSNYKEYLKIIYGDYTTYSPSAKYMVGDNLVEISADIYDTKKSYKEYVK